MQQCEYFGGDCRVQKCPYCEYVSMITKTLSGKVPLDMTISDALRYGKAWYDTTVTYKFVSCRKDIDENTEGNHETD